MPARAQSLPHWETGTISRVGEAPEITGANGSVVRFAYRTLWKARRHPVHVHVGDKVLFTRGVRDSGRASQVVLTSLAPSGHYPETAPHGRIYLSPQRTPEQRSPVPRATRGMGESDRGVSARAADIIVLSKLLERTKEQVDFEAAGGFADGIEFTRELEALRLPDNPVTSPLRESVHRQHRQIGW